MTYSQNVFVAGCMRSGTTAITRILENHPDVFLADRDNLGLPSDGNPTWESGIFVRLDSDEEILDRFRKLDGKAAVIVEKTPVHIFHLDRIRRLFPDAKFILPVRNGIDVVKSINVASKTFLKAAPKFSKSCKLWKNATEVIYDNRNRTDTQVIRYDDLMTHQLDVAQKIFKLLNLDSSNANEIVRRANDPQTERVQHSVGNTVLGRKTKSLSLRQALEFRIVCGQTQAKFSFTGFR